MGGEQTRREKQRKGNEGNRWVNERPSAEELGTWFSENVEVADGLDHADYVGGVTLIPGREKSQEVVGWDDLNSPVMQYVYDLVFTPYMRVETRVKYFHDLMTEEDWLGFIDPVAREKPDPFLPPGFFRFSIATKPGFEVRYIGCAMKVTVYEKEGFEQKWVVTDKRTGAGELVREGTIVLEAPPATKVVPTMAYGEADDFVVMKAETGAVGRALGMAGMLVIPGTGIVSAEDMQEVRDAPSGPEAAEAAELPPDAAPADFEPAAKAATGDAEDALRAEAKAAMDVLREQFPDTFEEFKRWALERGYNRLSEVTLPALRGVLRRAQSMLADAEKAAAEPPPAPEPAEPAADPLES